MQNFRFLLPGRGRERIHWAEPPVGRGWSSAVPTESPERHVALNLCRLLPGHPGLPPGEQGRQEARTLPEAVWGGQVDFMGTAWFPHPLA